MNGQLMRIEAIIVSKIAHSFSLQNGNMEKAIFRAQTCCENMNKRWARNHVTHKYRKNVDCCAFSRRCLLPELFPHFVLYMH